MISAFLVDDEPLAVRRLSRLLSETGRVEIAGASHDPVDAIAWLSSHTVDALFLDINMPGMNGFEMLRVLKNPPAVVFTTAYDHLALEAFRANSLDYLVKPVDSEQLERALLKLERFQPPAQSAPDLLARLEAALARSSARYPARIASRLGDRIQFLDLPRVTHFYAEDKLTFAVVKGRNYIVDQTISDLEQKLDPAQFFRIHRSTLLNLTWVREMDGNFVILGDESRTSLVVARDRHRALREKLAV